MSYKFRAKHAALASFYVITAPTISYADDVLPEVKVTEKALVKKRLTSTDCSKHSTGDR